MGLARHLAACGAALALIAAPTASAEHYVPWTDPLPPAPVPATEYRYGELNSLCPHDGSVDTRACVAATIAEMQRRYDAYRATCDHRGLFALAYLRTTEAYDAAAREPGFFSDVPWVDHEDTVFAQLWFDADDDWSAGRRERVPEAWRIALEAAEQRSVSGTGDVLLGISSHINRDLPYTLAVSGLVAPDGTSRKRDHDVVHRFLARVPDELFRELREEWDPSIEWRAHEQGIAAIALVQSWRENAWRSAERLVSASSDAERRAVEQAIEAYAAEANRTIRELTAYRAGQSSAARDAHCMASR